jgi:hypothetical protein
VQRQAEEMGLVFKGQALAQRGRLQYRRTDYDDVPLQPRPVLFQYRISDHPEFSGQVFVT